MKIENQQVKVGDEVRVGMQLMTVDEITEFDTVVVIDQDGEELELTENEIDVYVDRSKVKAWTNRKAVIQLEKWKQ